MRNHPTYINVLQGKTARFIQGISLADGLYTDSIITCSIIIFFGKKSGKNAISMTHFDYHLVIDKAIQYFLTESRWFDKVTHLYICYPSDVNKTGESNAEYFLKVFQPYFYDFCVRKNLPYKFQEIPDYNDTVIAFYNKTTLKICLDYKNSKNFITSDIILQNHPQAATMYSYCIINYIFSAFDGFFNYAKEGYDNKLTDTKEKNFEFYQGIKYHYTDIYKILATPLNILQLMFDGEKYNPPQKDDYTFSNFAKQIIEKLPKTSPVDPLFLCENLVILMQQLEASIFKDYKQHGRDNDITRYESMGVVIQHYINLMFPDSYSCLSDDYRNRIERYTEKYNNQKEFELLKKRANFKYRERKSISGLIFFSKSRYANYENPYGPYKDHYCSSNDPEVQLTQRLTELRNKIK